MHAKPPRLLSLSRAWVCVAINQLATPGLGSIAGGRVVAGIGQLVLAIVGFVLLMGWMGIRFYELMMEQSGGSMQPHSIGWMWKWGLVVFSAGWTWSLVTSISLLRQAAAQNKAEQRALDRTRGR